MLEILGVGTVVNGTLDSEKKNCFFRSALSAKRRLNGLNNVIEGGHLTDYLIGTTLAWH